MTCLKSLLIVFVLTLVATGCGDSDQASPMAAGTNASDTITQTAAGNAAAEPGSVEAAIAAAASEFLQAVIDGDTERATQRLTPKAIAQFRATGQAFASPDIGAPQFSVEQVRRVSEEEAAVVCLLSDPNFEAEMACLLRLVEGDWRVRGIAYEIDPNRPPATLDFEQAEEQIPDVRPGSQFVAEPPSGAPQQQPAARTATDPSTAPVR